MIVNYDYAEVYADTVRESLVAALADELGFQRDPDSIAPMLTTDAFELEFRRGPEAGANTGDFTSYATLIEVATRGGEENDEIVELVGRVVSAVRTQGHAAVPVADFDVESASPTAQVGYVVTGDGRLARRRVVGGTTRDEVFSDDFRWQASPQPLDGLAEISKQEADSFIERRSNEA